MIEKLAVKLKIEEEPIPFWKLEKLCAKAMIDKINELVDAVNRYEDIIRQIGEWGSSKGECLWCENLTKVNLNDRMIGCTTLDIPESYKKSHKAPETELERTRKALEIAIDGIKYMRNNCLEYAADYMDKADEILEQIKALEQKEVNYARHNNVL